MIGQYLSNLRKEAGLTVEEMALRTRIRLDYLKAIENDSLDKVPADVYTKGYIRTYLKTLSIDPAEGLRIYAEQKGAAHADTPSHQTSPVGLTDKKPAPRIVIAVVFITLLSAGLYYYGNTIHTNLSFFSTSVNKNLTSNVTSNVTAQDVPPAQKLVGSETTSIDDSSRKAPEETPKSKETAKPTPLSRPTGTPEQIQAISAAKPEALKHTLQLQATSLTWVSVQIDNKDTHQRLMNPGESIEWNAGEAFVLKLGNAGGVKLTLDGEYLGVPGESGRVVTITLPKKTPTPVQ
ncbi:MAG: helix-turn-helix domain-containing protein [Nitrospirae bacterium]|nr:helix-turn-helix domain-containing protein [Nitrospirota bacterium]